MRLTIYDGGELMPTDSGEYELLREAALISATVPGAGCEIGVRRGGGSRAIMEAFISTGVNKTHVMVDPWGDIPYLTTEENRIVLPTDYTNEMRSQFFVDLGVWSQGKNVNPVVINLTDEDFFLLYANGVPTYVGKQRVVETNYCIVHLDGPHSSEPVNREAEWFSTKMLPGAMLVCDDVEGYYDHWEKSDPYIRSLGFDLYKRGNHKALYRKK